MAKKIIVNGRFLLHRITGVERYAHELLAELDYLIQPGEIEMAVPPETEILPNYENIRVVRVGKLHNRLWEHLSFPTYVSRSKGISLNLCNVAPLPNPGIVCLMDAKTRAHPEFYSKGFLLWYRLLFRNACGRTRHIITISEFSKSELCRYYRIKPEHITVIPCAWQHLERIGFDETALEKYGLKAGDYFFSVCSLEPNKNFPWIANAARRNPDAVFVVAGSLNPKVFSEALCFDLPANMKLIGYVSDEEAKTLMRDCRAFLFPSFYEGFGLPPLEALSVGATVISSNTSSLPEVLQDSVHYIDPYNSDVVLEKLLGEPVGEREHALLRYSWRESAEKLYAVIKQFEN